MNATISSKAKHVSCPSYAKMEEYVGAASLSAIFSAIRLAQHIH